MAKTNSLYGGFIGGKSRAISFGPQDPSVIGPETLADKQAKAQLQAHYTVGIKQRPPISGVRRPASTAGVAGRKVSGAARVSGGTV